MGMRIIAVRALWGDERVVTHRKSIADARRAASQSLGIEQHVYCYGLDNQRFVRDAGIEPTLLNTEGIVNWEGTDIPRNPEEEGRINWGLSMWRHKLEALIAAFNDQKPAGIIWLDWDTIISRPVDHVLRDRLSVGARFQGRNRQYCNPHAPWRSPEFGKRRIYHGGCFYVRDAEIVRAAIKIQAEQYRLMTDETALTKVVDDVILGGERHPEQHRVMGVDNPLLYSTNHNVLPSNEPACFQEGRIKHVGANARRENIRSRKLGSRK